MLKSPDDSRGHTPRIATEKNRRRALRQAKFERFPHDAAQPAAVDDGGPPRGEDLAFEVRRAAQGRTETDGAEALHRIKCGAVRSGVSLPAPRRPAGACLARSVSTVLSTATDAAGATSY